MGRDPKRYKANGDKKRGERKRRRGGGLVGICSRGEIITGREE